jgi:hypothetical protein
MRFLANGPSIPDELLVARDEGRVIFFCGAGVSRARAGLPDFFGLAQNVIETLGVTGDDPTRRILKEAQDIDRRTGISGLISADRVFGLLERNFLARDIEMAVAMALKPKTGVDLSAHRVLLDLARAPNGKVRLVTTNFDLLFESCDGSLLQSRPPRLPDPQRIEEFEGIIHLHGQVDGNYKGAAGDGFVLSSSEFGRAYLSNGWATSFIRSVLDKYVVVFVGYTADDPPVRYLLEALNSYSLSLENVYAFQAGPPDEAEAKWRHKGAKAISYDEAEGHKALWDTLTAWASRARAPDAWYENVISLARKGPEVLPPHERGQVAHVVSTVPGARKFSTSGDPPPAEWLCVFDPKIRFSQSGYLGSFPEQGPYFDPFEAYGLDSDPVPPKSDPKNYLAKREVPDSVWNCFDLTKLDLKDLKDDDFAALRGYRSVNVPGLPARLRQLGVWISRISNQPAAVWWASRQAGIHSEVQDLIRLELGKSQKRCAPEVRRSWRYIFEAWQKRGNEFDRGWYLLKSWIDLDGWTKPAIRELALMLRPFLKAEKRIWGDSKPPENKEGVRLEDMVVIDAEYPAPDDDVQIPDEFLHAAVREFRKNLEHAVNLENELGKGTLDLLCPIEPDPNLEGESFERTYGISPSVLFYVSLMKRLIEKDPQAAKQEYLAWWTEEETVFTRLRIWVSGYQRILSGIEAGRLLCSLSDESFWDGHHQRDLLLILAKRWNDFPVTVKNRLERRLLCGPSRWESENPGEYPKRCAWLSLNRIHWLEAQGCKFTFDVNAESAKLQKAAPDWQIQYATSAAASREGRAGSVRTDTGYSALLNEPLGTLLSRASEISGSEHELLARNDPFAGLASERPVRAFLALVICGKRNDYPEWAWRTFLFSEARKKDKPKFTALIAERLARLSPGVIAEFMLPASDWLLKLSKVLLSAYPGHYERVWAKLISVLRSNKRTAESFSSRHNKESGWATEALNSPVGKLAESLMDDPAKDQLGAGKGLPPTWIGRVEELLALEGDLRRHALVMFAFNLNWFFAIDPVWTEQNLISVLDQEGDDQDAIWDGLFWNAKVPSPKLYMRIKPHLLNLARRKPVVRPRHSEVLSGILLAGWGSIDEKTGESWITNAEMRDVLLDVDDDFRSHTLRYLERWPRQAGEWRTKSLAFLTAVWPRHNKAKSPRISARLCDLAFSDADNFSEMADAILPLVTKINQEHIVLHDLRRRNKGDIVDRFPEKVLSLLHTVLPENASAWPYGIEATLDGIGAADPSLLNDARLIELKRQWNARR